MSRSFIFLGVGFELVSLCLGGIYLGEKLDRYFKSNGLATIGLILLLLVGWFVHFFVLLNRFDREGDS